MHGPCVSDWDIYILAVCMQGWRHRKQQQHEAAAPRRQDGADLHQQQQPTAGSFKPQPCQVSGTHRQYSTRVVYQVLLTQASLALRQLSLPHDFAPVQCHPCS